MVYYISAIKQLTYKKLLTTKKLYLDFSIKYTMPLQGNNSNAGINIQGQIGVEQEQTATSHAMPGQYGQAATAGGALATLVTVFFFLGLHIVGQWRVHTVLQALF